MLLDQYGAIWHNSANFGFMSREVKSLRGLARVIPGRITNRGVATGGGGGAPQKKIMHTYFLICQYRACVNTLLPTKNHAYAFLKYALKCLFVNGCSSPSILKEIALLLCKKFQNCLSSLARIYVHRFSQC